MIIRKLKPKEHILTRELWEMVFQEDSEKFLNYYYNDITAKNDIYVIETDGEIRAMLHLNPYRLMVGTKEVDSRYIVAVATDSRFRSRGFMTELLKKSLRDMYHQGIPFSYLMPAAEEIYYPHHFRYIYRARQWKIERQEPAKQGEWELRAATSADCESVASYVRTFLEKRYHVYTQRDALYYEIKLHEQESMDGGIFILEKAGEMKGVLLLDEENGKLSVREPMVDEEGRNGLEALGYFLEEGEKKPTIMARVIHAEELLSCVKCKEEVSFSFILVDPVVKENSKLYMIRGNSERTVVRTKPWVRGKEQGVQMISIDALTSLLFGYHTVEEIEEEEQEVFSAAFKDAIMKLEPLNSVYINEIV